MKKLGAVCLSVLLSLGVSRAQNSAYFNAITNLNPAGYWPMHEIEAPVRGDSETNYGTLGLLGTAYYPDWATADNYIKRGAPGILTNDNDTAVNFTRGGSPPAGTFTNALFIPHTSPLTTLNPPFSVECWFYPTNLTSEDIWAQSGFEGLNAGGSGNGNGAVGGVRLVWMNSTNTGFQIFTYYNSSTLISQGFAGNINGGPQLYPTNQWYHLVVTCDADTNMTLYINGSYAFSSSAVGLYAVDYWTPLTIGSGRGGTRAVAGYIDEFAVYTNVIGDPDTHYSDALTGAAGVYFQDVTNDNPTIYLRMDAPTAYSAPAVGAWPVLTNYGMTNGVATGNGVYTPGTVPGLVTNQIVNVNGVPFGGVPSTLAALSGISSYADAGRAAAYNPIGPVPFSVTALFRGNPCDGRNNTIIGHSDNSWNLMLNNNGHLFWRFGTNTVANVSSLGVYNDGNWHQVVAVYTPNSNPTLPGTNALYVDGALESFTNNATPNGFLPGTNLDVLIGNDPQFTNTPYGVGRSFAGQICDVAIFTNSLTSTQIQALYGAAGVAPFITGQPAGGAIVGGSGTATTLNVIARGSAPLAYQWYFNSTPDYSGATRFLDGSKYAGSTSSQVTITNLAGTDSGYYYVVVTNNYGSITSTLASLTVYAAPVILGQSPVTYTNLFTLFTGASPAFSIYALAAPPVYYYWYTNGVLDTAVTASNLIWTNVPLGVISNYCVVSNFLGMATSTVWTASVIAQPTAPYPTNVLALKPIGYWRLNDNDPDGNGNVSGFPANDYLGGNNGVYTNSSLGQPGYSQSTDPGTTSAQFGIYSFTDCDAYGIGGIDFSAPTNTSVAFSIEAWVSGYTQTKDAGLVSKGYNGAEQFDLDTGSHVVIGKTTNYNFRFFVRDAAGASHIANSKILPDGNWHHLVGVCDEANSNVTLYVDGLVAGSASISPGSGILSSSRLMIIGSRPGNATTNNNLQFVGNMNDVAVYNYALSPSQVAASYTSIGGLAPTATLSPTNVTLNQGATLTISASAVGTPPLGYYWTEVNGNTSVASGTTNGVPLNPSLVVSNVPGAWNNDQLELTVTNAYGSVNLFVSLTVITNLTITQDLAPQVALRSGLTYTYSAGVIGPIPYYYQWYNAGVPIAGQTNSSYTATAGAAGPTTYYVVVSNIYSTAITSAVSTLTTIVLSNSYATNLLQFNPVGYWPMHEVATWAHGDTETNYGSLGNLANGYYADWVNLKSINHNFPGAIVNSSNAAINFNYAGGGDASGPTNYLAVPHTSPLATLNPPFSVECWFRPTNTQAGDIWGQAGAVGLNNGGNWAGVRLYWNGSVFIIYNYSGNNGSTLNSSGGGATYSVNQWYHLVVTCDANTNMQLYVNGNPDQLTPYAAAGLFSPDYWSPLQIGSSRGFSRSIHGGIDEFAVYTTNLSASDIAQHYSDGVSGGGDTAYVPDVTNDNPVIYFRMDSPTYSNPSLSTWPALNNFGSSAVSGIYRPGVVPGAAAGPAAAGLGASNAMAGNGMSGFADAGFAPALNPAGASQTLSLSAWFKGNPTDARLQTIIGHSDNSWRMALTAAGNLQFAVGTDTALTSSGVYNDGSWHQAVGVYDGIGGSEYLYVDGALVSSAPLTVNSIPGTNLDVFIGSDPQYTNNPVARGRQFSGNICEAAFFTNALTAANVQALYNSAGLAPAITGQPFTGRTVPSGTGTYIYFGVIANGSPTLAYQWYFNASSNYSGATRLVDDGIHYTSSTTSQVTVSNLTTADSGYYFVVITNSYGAVTSRLASLIVTETTPSIISQLPQPYTNLFTLYAGASPVFSVNAGGALPIAYYWYTNGVLDSAVTTSNLFWPNVQPNSLTAYCVASNFLGTATSAVWTASVIAAPTPPYPRAVMAATPVGYWRLNEADDNLSDGNPGAICHDYAGGNNGLYTNVLLSAPGYRTNVDADTAAQFGAAAFTQDSHAYGIQGVDFSQPSGSNAEFSIEAWVNLPGLTNSPIVAMGYGSGGEQFVLDAANTSSNYFRFIVRDAAGGSHACNSTFQPDGNWHHVVGVCDEANTNLSLYVDGVDVTNVFIAAGTGLQAAKAGNNGLNDNWMSIGARTKNSSATNYSMQTIGTIDEVAVYNYAFTSSQVTALYNAGISSGVNTNPTNIVFSLAGGQITLSWPADHIGWQLQSNSVGLRATGQWFTVSGSTGTNQMTFTPDRSKTNVFYRMLHQ